MAARKITATKKSTPRKSTTKRATKDRKVFGMADYFKIGESYTSLVLGIIVVIVASLLLLSLFKTRSNDHVDSQKGTTSISTVADKTDVSPTPTDGIDSPTLPRSGQKTYTVKAGDNLWSIAQSQYNDGYQWTLIAKANNLTNPGTVNVGNVLTIPESKSVAMTKPTTQTVTQTNVSASTINGTSYTIVHGDDLWDIAVRAYGDGYKWVDIAKANNLSNPGVIHAGNKLILPRK